jgi:hypothetical protein
MSAVISKFSRSSHLNVTCVHFLPICSPYVFLESNLCLYEDFAVDPMILFGLESSTGSKRELLHYLNESHVL